MCGFVACTGRWDPTVVESMLEAIRSRGPDEQRLVDGGWYSLGVARLAIVATTSGGQPVSTPDGSVTLAFNGELYDFREQVAARGEGGPPITCEAGLLLDRYLTQGPAVFEQLDGDFAVAVFDSRTRTCHLARDRRGVKPLYYAVLPTGLVAASEMRALVRHPAVPLDWDETTLTERRVLWFSAADRTLIRQIRQVPPGHRLEVSAETRPVRIDVVPYGPPDESSFAYEPVADAEALVARCREAITRAVRRQTEHTDIEPVVVALSGGVDSSIIAVAAARATGRKIVGVTVGGPEQLDAHYASLVAKELEIDHHLHEVTSEDILRELPAMVLALGGNGPAYTPYFLGEAVRRCVPGAKVLLCGEGADEVFAGYWIHVDPERFLARARERMQSVPAVAAAGSILLHDVFDPDVDVSLAHRRLLRSFQRDQLVSNHLLPFDHASMAHAVECRVPFLDHSVLDFAEQFPAATQPAGRVSKPALRLVLERMLADSPLLRDGLLGRVPSGAPMATDSARAELRRVLDRELRDAPVSRSPLARFARGPEDLFWLGAFDVAFRQRRGDINGTNFAELLEGVRDAG